LPRIAEAGAGLISVDDGASAIESESNTADETDLASATMCCVRLCALSGSGVAFSLLSAKSGVELQHISGIAARRDLLGRIADMRGQRC